MKKPYIPLYVGDWVKDTDCISIEAEGALLRILFKLWESETPGSLSFRFSQIAFLLKKPETEARKIIQELRDNRILDFKFEGEPDEKGLHPAIKIESRRMIKEAHKSQINSENGSKGGRPAKEEKEEEKPIKSELKAKAKRNADIDIDIDNEIDIDIDKGGTGGKLIEAPPQVQNPFSPEFLPGIWETWKQHRRDKKCPIKSVKAENAALKHLHRLARGDESTATAMLEKAISNGWQGFDYAAPIFNPPPTPPSLNGKSGIYKPIQNKTQ